MGKFSRWNDDRRKVANMSKHQVADAQYAQTLAAGQTEAEAEFRAQAVRYVPDGANNRGTKPCQRYAARNVEIGVESCGAAPCSPTVTASSATWSEEMARSRFRLNVRP
jgi:hypothetical protein